MRCKAEPVDDIGVRAYVIRLACSASISIRIRSLIIYFFLIAYNLRARRLSGARISV